MVFCSVWRRVVAIAFVALAACDGEPEEIDGGLPPARVTPRFDPTADPIAFGAVPWPDDLYLDGSGRIAVGELPGEEMAIPRDYPESLRTALADLDGFSPVAPVFFYFPPRSLTASSLPSSPAESTAEGSSVFLVDADPASPTAFQRVPILVHYEPELGQLALRPADGHPLAPGRKYAAVVTTGVLDDQGMPIGPAPSFARVRDAETPPDDPILAEASDRYRPVLASLGSEGIARERIAAMAVFTVQRIAPDLRDARAIVWDGEAPAVTVDAIVPAGEALDRLLGAPELDVPGVDVPGGVAHGRIASVIHGRVRSPSFLSETLGVHGRFLRDDGGALRVLAIDEVPFTIALPRGDLSRVPVVVFQHGLGAERSEMFALADALAGAGYAVIAIDIPFHGMRAAQAYDLAHRFTGAEMPDGFGDATGQEVQLEFLGIVEDQGELPPFHPAYVRDVFRQSAVDLMTIVRMVREGDWSSVRASVGLEALAFAPDRMGFVGVSLGGIIGTIFVASEPEIGAAILNVTGGDLGRLVEWSAAFADLFLPILFPRLGLDPRDYDPRAYPASFHPGIAIFQTVLDRGDSMSYAPILASAPTNVLFQMAEHDEVVPNRATEALVRAAGGEIVGADPAYTELARVDAPVVGNVEVSEGRVTRGLFRFGPATHGLLSRRSDAQRFAHPPEPPFTPIEPIEIANPVDGAVEQVVHFFESWRSGGAEIVAPVP